MTTDKTLADAKPGGCVQLPTSECERFEAWAESSGEGLSRWPDGLYVRQATQVAWDAWQAALSAQPSPGGQDAHELWALAQLVPGEGIEDGVRRIEAALAARQPVEVSEGAFRAAASRQPVTDIPECAKRAMYDEVWSALHSAGFGDELASSIAAMAARQPVGEAIGEIVYSGEGGLQIEFYDGKPLAPMKLYATPPAQQPAQVHLDGLDRALGEAIDQRDRYHEVADDLAGHIAAITSVDIGEHSSANCPWQNAIEAAEEYKPAQAVDLGQFQDVLLAANSRLQSVIDDDKTKWSERHKASKEQAALYPLLALIDGKAVGK